VPERQCADLTIGYTAIINNAAFVIRDTVLAVAKGDTQKIIAAPGDGDGGGAAR